MMLLLVRGKCRSIRTDKRHLQEYWIRSVIWIYHFYQSIFLTISYVPDSLQQTGDKKVCESKIRALSLTEVLAYLSGKKEQRESSRHMKLIQLYLAGYTLDLDNNFFCLITDSSDINTMVRILDTITVEIIIYLLFVGIHTHRKNSG